MKLIIVVRTIEDLPEDAPYDCMNEVEETLKEHEMNVEDITFEIEG